MGETDVKAYETGGRTNNAPCKRCGRRVGTMDENLNTVHQPEVPEMVGEGDQGRTRTKENEKGSYMSSQGEGRDR